MERELAIKIENVKKQYRLGAIGGGTLQGDLQSWWARVRGKEDPNSKIGQKTYSGNERFYALNGISFDVYKGERLGIIGGNGAGKSTTLKLLSRVTAPTEGTIYINGRISSMLEVGTGFHPELTGRENIYLNGAILGMSKAEVDSKIEDIIDFSECRQFIDTPVKRYSSGMYVKLAFAVAAHLDSEILVMDEVLAVGDMKFQQKCLGKMSDVAENEGRTVLYVSHNMNTIRQLCDRCIVLDHGRVIFDGDVEEAISIYMNAVIDLKQVDINLTDKRMKHLSPIILAKMTHLTLLNKKNPIYEMNENILFKLRIKSEENLSNISVRIEIRTFDEVSVGAAIIQNFSCINKEEKDFVFKFNPYGLIPGKYSALLVLYEVNDMGVYNDLDAIFPAFQFEIIENQRFSEIHWNMSHWGKIRFENLMLMGE